MVFITFTGALATGLPAGTNFTVITNAGTCNFVTSRDTDLGTSAPTIFVDATVNLVKDFRRGARRERIVRRTDFSETRNCRV